MYPMPNSCRDCFEARFLCITQSVTAVSALSSAVSDNMSASTWRSQWQQFLHNQVSDNSSCMTQSVTTVPAWRSQWQQFMHNKANDNSFWLRTQWQQFLYFRQSYKKKQCHQCHPLHHTSQFTVSPMSSFTSDVASSFNETLQLSWSFKCNRLYGIF